MGPGRWRARCGERDMSGGRAENDSTAPDAPERTRESEPRNRSWPALWILVACVGGGVAGFFIGQNSVSPSADDVKTTRAQANLLGFIDGRVNELQKSPEEPIDRPSASDADERANKSADGHAVSIATLQEMKTELTAV